jgi:hypothetical protein
MSLFEDVHPAHGAPALVGLFILAGLAEGYVGSLADIFAAPAVLIILAVFLGMRYG